MTDIPRLNGVIKALEEGKPAFVCFSPAEIGALQAVGGQPYDGVILEMEHSPYDIWQMRNGLHHLLDRRQIALSGSLAPTVTPLVRIPANGWEMNQWLAKQVLDQGVYGVIWPHVSSVDEAYNAVSACRYTRPEGSPRFEPVGRRGDSTRIAARYWGLTAQEYYARADVWPLDPKGEIFVGIMVEELRGVKNLPDMLAKVPGIGVVIIGEGDLSQDLGVPRQYNHPSVKSAVDEVLAVCREHNVPCGMPHAEASRVEELLERGFRMLMTPPERTFTALEAARAASGRS